MSSKIEHEIDRDGNYDTGDMILHNVSLWTEWGSLVKIYFVVICILGPGAGYVARTLVLYFLLKYGKQLGYDVKYTTRIDGETEVEVTKTLIDKESQIDDED